MTTQEGNLLIAKFMGWEVHPRLSNKLQRKDIKEGYRKLSDFMFIDSLCYHSDWNELMTVIEQLHSMGKMISINFYTEGNKPVECRIYNWGVGDPEFENEQYTAILSVWNTVVQEINWINATELA